MKFWEWLIELAGRVQVTRKSVAIAEYIIGGAGIAVGASLWVASEISPIWLALTIPVGVFMSLHGYWRAWVRKNI